MDKFLETVNTYAPYLEDARRRLYSSAIIFIVVFLGGFFSSGLILKKILVFFQLENVLVSASSPFQFAEVAVDIGFTLAIFVIFPVLIYHFFSFISPALEKSEKRRFLLLIPVGLGLFVAGFAYGFGIMYYALGILASLNESVGIENIWDVSQFLTQIFLTSALLGLLFQFPLILSVMAKIGLIDSDFLRRKRKLAVCIALVLAALLPPTDGLSLIVMTLPLVVLYEATILLNS